MTETSPTTVSKAIFDLEEDSVDVATNKIILRLAASYRVLQPEKSFDDFFEELVTPSFSISEGPIPLIVSGNTIYSAQANRGSMLLLATSLLHCVAATAADTADTQMQAWNQVANAAYYLGQVEGLQMVEPGIAHIISSRSAKGGTKRVSKYVPLRELAVKLVEQTRYENKNKAAIAIKDEIMAESNRLEVGLMELNVIKTISGWISKCEFGRK